MHCEKIHHSGAEGNELLLVMDQSQMVPAEFCDDICDTTGGMDDTTGGLGKECTYTPIGKFTDDLPDDFLLQALQEFEEVCKQYGSPKSMKDIDVRSTTKNTRSK